MIHAYSEKYLNDAMENLGEAFDYAVNVCYIDIEEFMDLFISTGFADSFASGMPKVIAGLSGTELVIEIMNKAGYEFDYPEQQIEYDFSEEYWCGWILGYYQWYTGRTFKDIRIDVSMKEIRELYPVLHEASEDKFVDTLNSIIRRKNKPTRLQNRRKQCGLSQRVLANRAEVNLRTLQQYEMRAKDINKAAVTTLVSLAKVLGCKIEDLLEYTMNESNGDL